MTWAKILHAVSRVPSSVLVTLLLICVACGRTAAQPANPDPSSSITVALDGLSQIQYSTSSRLAVGDALSSADLSAPRERCIEYDERSLRPDTAGAVTSRMRAVLVRSFDELKSQLNYNFSIAASANAGIDKILSGESSVTATGKFEAFFRNQRNGLMLVVEASADHGRTLISDFKLRDEYAALISEGNFARFTERCGTHFIRGETRRSQLRVIFHLSSSDSEARTAIESTWRSYAKGSLTVEAATVGASSELNSGLTATLSLASRISRVTADVEATGGNGVATVSRLLPGLQVSNATDIQQLLQSIAEAGNDFTLANSAPDTLLIIPHPQLPTIAPFDAQRFEALGAIYQKLLRLDAALDEYRGYHRDSPVLWERYFRIYQERLESLRTQLITAYQSCRRGQDCATNVPDIIDGVFLDNILSNGELTADCQSTRTVDTRLNAVSSAPITIISSITLSYAGQIRFVDQVDLDGTEVYRVTPQLARERVPFRPRDYFRMSASDGEPRSIFMMPYARVIDPRTLIKDGELDYGALAAIRADVARSIIVVAFSLPNGRVVEQVLGYPDMRRCVSLEGRR